LRADLNVLCLNCIEVNCLVRAYISHHEIAEIGQKATFPVFPERSEMQQQQLLNEKRKTATLKPKAGA
jgi:hypothetical protein